MLLLKPNSQCEYFPSVHNLQYIMLLLKPTFTAIFPACKIDLQYIMLLLKPFETRSDFPKSFPFTIHNASIKT